MFDDTRRRRIKVYLAGPYSADTVPGMLCNIRNGNDRAASALKFGFSVYSPWLDHQFAFFADISTEEFRENSMEWLRVSDAVLLMEGWEGSKGTRAELEEASRIGIPVFETFYGLIQWADDRLLRERESGRGQSTRKGEYEMTYRPLEIEHRRTWGRPLISLRGKPPQLTLFRETYEMMRDRVKNRRDFPGIQVLVDPDNPTKFVIRPAAKATGKGVLPFRKKSARTLGAGSLLAKLNWKRKTMRLAGKWVPKLGDGALEFDIRKPAGAE